MRAVTGLIQRVVMRNQACSYLAETATWFGGEEVAAGEEESSGVGPFRQRSERGELGSTCLRLCGCEFE